MCSVVEVIWEHGGGIDDVLVDWFIVRSGQRERTTEKPGIEVAGGLLGETHGLFSCEELQMQSGEEGPAMDLLEC